MLTLQMHAITPGYYVDAWDPNSGLHAYSVGTLPTEPSLQAHGDNFECKSQDFKEGTYVLRVSAISGE